MGPMKTPRNPADYDARIPAELRVLAADAGLPAPSLYSGRLYPSEAANGNGNGSASQTNGNGATNGNGSAPRVKPSADDSSRVTPRP